MDKNEFLRQLDRLLHQIPTRDRREILHDLDEHFTIGFNAGKTDQEIINELGDPHAIAEEALTDYRATDSNQPPPEENLTRQILVGTGMFFFNLIVVLGPFVGIISAYIGLCVVPAVFIITPFFSLALLFQPDEDAFLFTFFSALFLCGFGILLGVAMIFIGKCLWGLFVRYLQFNIDVIKGRKREQ
ncbi:MAG: DUF1700 domain-containing protein [Sporolactobacillus sp.]|jgi:uncharacterized membrane protein|nr:DUF1700 domain-containing protein [Sporolactobacillus sp.]